MMTNRNESRILPDPTIEPATKKDIEASLQRMAFEKKYSANS